MIHARSSRTLTVTVKLVVRVFCSRPARPRSGRATSRDVCLLGGWWVVVLMLVCRG